MSCVAGADQPGQGAQETIDDCWLTAQEILVGNADYPTPKIGENSRAFRQLGIGYANLGALLMAQGLPYDSDDASLIRVARRDWDKARRMSKGYVGPEQHQRIVQDLEQAGPGELRVIVIHHHLVPIPGTGRERNIITDAGDLLAVLTRLDIDVVLSGHKHVPFFWGLNGILVCNSGTTATKRLRGLTPPSWNEVIIDATTMKVFTHYSDKRRELSVIRSRTTRAMIREAFYLTDDFLASNKIASL